LDRKEARRLDTQYAVAASDEAEKMLDLIRKFDKDRAGVFGFRNYGLETFKRS
jgi:hypothetical protein